MAGLADFRYKHWRDASGLVHKLEPIAFSGLVGGVTWSSLCGRFEPAIRNCIDTKTPMTCVQCIGNFKNEHSRYCRHECVACVGHIECLKPHPCALCAEEET